MEAECLHRALQGRSRDLTAPWQPVNTQEPTGWNSPQPSPLTHKDNKLHCCKCNIYEILTRKSLAVVDKTPWRPTDGLTRACSWTLEGNWRRIHPSSAVVEVVSALSDSNWDGKQVPSALNVDISAFHLRLCLQTFNPPTATGVVTFEVFFYIVSFPHTQPFDDNYWVGFFWEGFFLPCSFTKENYKIFQADLIERLTEARRVLTASAAVHTRAHLLDGWYSNPDSPPLKSQTQAGRDILPPPLLRLDGCQVEQFVSRSSYTTGNFELRRNFWETCRKTETEAAVSTQNVPVRSSRRRRKKKKRSEGKWWDVDRH